MRPVLQPAAEFEEQARLAEPGLAGEQHELAAARVGAAERLLEDLELALAADEAVALRGDRRHGVRARADARDDRGVELVGRARPEPDGASLEVAERRELTRDPRRGEDLARPGMAQEPLGQGEGVAERERAPGGGVEQHVAEVERDPQLGTRRGRVRAAVLQGERGACRACGRLLDGARDAERGDQARACLVEDERAEAVQPLDERLLQRATAVHGS